MPEVQMRTQCWTRVVPGERKDGLKQGQYGLAKEQARDKDYTNDPLADQDSHHTFRSGLRN